MDSSFGRAIGDAWAGMFKALGCLLAVALGLLPFAVWKWVDIAVWLWRHVKVSWGD